MKAIPKSSLVQEDNELALGFTLNFIAAIPATAPCPQHELGSLAYTFEVWTNSQSRFSVSMLSGASGFSAGHFLLGLPVNPAPFVMKREIS